MKCQYALWIYWVCTNSCTLQYCTNQKQYYLCRQVSIKQDLNATSPPTTEGNIWLFSCYVLHNRLWQYVFVVDVTSHFHSSLLWPVPPLKLSIALWDDSVHAYSKFKMFTDIFDRRTTFSQPMSVICEITDRVYTDPGPKFSTHKKLQASVAQT